MLSFNLPTVVGISVPQLSPAAGGPTVCTSQSQRPQDCFRTREQGYSDGLLNVANVNQVNVRVNYIPKDSKSGAVRNFHISVQRQLPLGFVLDTGYVGTRADNLMILGDFNQARPNAPTESLNINTRRPISGFGQIQIAADQGFLQYDSLQAKIERRQGSLYFVNSFTYSRGFDSATDHGENLNGDNSRLNYRNLNGERGYSGYDQRWNNTTTFVYDLPFGKGRRYLSSTSWLVDGALGGWRLNAFHTVNAGLPLNLNYSPQVDFQVGSFTYRPNLIGNPVMPESERQGGTRTRFLNPATVVAPTDRSQPFGNSFRNGVRGPLYYAVDLGLHKEFKMTERFTTQFRFEAFNLFNRTNFLGVDTNRTSGTFGLFTNTLPARELQFALKLLF